MHIKKNKSNLLKLTCAISSIVFSSYILADENGPTKKDLTSKSLEVASQVIQNFSPLKSFNIFIMAFHPLKNNPHHQMAAYHYCKKNNAEILQCIIFDDDTKDANITGVEYIIPEKYFFKLSKKERKHWHPHNYEILSGQLIAPGLPSQAEKLLLKKEINSYGKTYHFLLKNMNDKDESLVSIGTPELAWSFNHNNEVFPKLISDRDKKYHTHTATLAKQRQDLVPLAHPQCGVNTLINNIKLKSETVPGVKDKKGCY